ncbi:MAG TPA: DUF429 domain-containing protein [Candidatus Aquabacterium excrementipullorum]|nr:DUF429 domain-containing protein [Candidatus Aquabacterium excrementipullorum]
MAPEAPCPPLPATLLGVDFSCAPSTRKPIVAAWGRRHGAVVKLEGLEPITTLAGFEALLSPSHARAAEGWVGGFDFPFGLPSVFLQALRADAGRPLADTRALIHYLRQRCPDRQAFQQLVDGWGVQWGAGTRPATLPHRRCDSAMSGISSTSPLQTRYVPVGKMYFEGLWRLVQAGVTLPGMWSPPASDAGADSDQQLRHRLAFEAYPGLLAHEILGRQSYKSDARDHIDAARRLVQRLSLIDALEQGRTRLGLRLKLTPAQRDHLASDPQGDRLDAVLCLVQAGWAHTRLAEGDALAGRPADMDPVEGWILTA